MVLRVQRYPISRPLFEDLFNLEQGIDGLLGGFLGTRPSAWSREYPAIDIAEYENQSVVVAEIPGVEKEDVKISVHGGVLTISGERKGSALPEGSNWIRNERNRGNFVRTVELPHETKPDAITAELTNGVLRVVLPKAEEARPREIKVK